MTLRPLYRRQALLLFAAVPAACSSPNPTLYTLAPTSGEVRKRGPRTVEMRAIALARYLERSQIVRSSEGFRLEVLENEWWGEPLDSMLGRVLVQDLTQRLPNATIYQENSPISGTPDATLGINIQRLDLDRSGVVLLRAQMSVTKRATATRNVTISVTPATAGTQGLVAAMSEAVGQLADQAAALLVA
ncbi:MAG: membrane integrity-associated transporter subunit PqiC [Acetobacteraceae bacterium]